MKRITFLVIFLTISLWLFGQSENEFKISAHFPSDLVQNVKTDYIITIEKPYLQPFASYEQQFPKGVHVSPVDVDDGVFSYNDNVVNVSWVRLPAAKSVSYKFNILVDSTCHGKFKTVGILNYVYSNRNGVAFTDTVSFSATGAKGLKSIDDEQEPVMPSCSRSIKANGNVFTVRLKFNGYKKMGTTRVTEIIPDGYIVKLPKKKNGAQIVQTGNKLEFIWNKLHEAQTNELSYELRSERGNQMPEIQGEIAFSLNGKLQQQDIKNE